MKSTTSHQPARAQPRVLITDDDASVRLLLSTLCRRRGFVCDIAQDGADALARIAGATYDLILLDLMMPRVNGYELITAVRQLRNRPVVIVVTARDTPYENGSDLDSDVVHAVVRKPFDFDALVSIMTDAAAENLARGAVALHVGSRLDLV